MLIILNQYQYNNVVVPLGAMLTMNSSLDPSSDKIVLVVLTSPLQIASRKAI